MRVKINRMPGIVINTKERTLTMNLAGGRFSECLRQVLRKCVFQTTSIMPVGLLSDPEYLLS